MGNPGSVFEGTAVPLPEPIPRGAAIYKPQETAEAPVRHAQGYGLFARFAVDTGAEPRELAADFERLITFLGSSAKHLAADEALAASAMIFVGNAVVRLRPDAEWQAYAGQPPAVGSPAMQFELPRMFEHLLGAQDARRQLTRVILEWALDTDDGGFGSAPMPAPIPALLAEGTQRFVRPTLPRKSFRALDGAVINYGHRWEENDAPADSYSRESNLERFAGIQTVAHALISFLAREYDVQVSQDPAYARDLLLPSQEPLPSRFKVLQATRVVASDPASAPLTFVFTAYPGVAVHAGVLHDFSFPACGCDACDDTAETEAERLEQLVLGVAAGGYGERYPIGRKRLSEYVLTHADGSGSESGRGEVWPLPAGLALAAEQRLQALPEGWRPWPRRTPDSLGCVPGADS